MEVVKLNKDNFETEVKESNKVVLVDFYADWCGPCKMMSPVIDEIAKEVGENIKICKLNVDEAQDIAIEYGVMSIPTLIIFKAGNEVNKLIGLQSKSEVMEALNV
ncbi:MAG: thioredoxin [Clostridia bacterium]|nr:thioredoxin [Clostridia bacterium]MBR4261276.1 thioredoxin [Clostridia bacterium]